MLYRIYSRTEPKQSIFIKMFLNRNTRNNITYLLDPAPVLPPHLTHHPLHPTTPNRTDRGLHCIPEVINTQPTLTEVIN